jgi:hypothetical protein
MNELAKAIHNLIIGEESLSTTLSPIEQKALEEARSFLHDVISLQLDMINDPGPVEWNIPVPRLLD